jgi:hypothetical protein
MASMETRMHSTTTPWFDEDGLQTDVSGYRGQFVLSRSTVDLPPGWPSVQANGWHLAVNDLPIQPLTHGSKFLGWCIGYPLGKQSIAVDPNNIDSFYERFGGSWALLLVGMNRLMLDPGGQLAAVYNTQEHVVASTPTLIRSAQPRNLQFERDVGFPEHDGWFPFGLTSRANVRRLLPNHQLDLERWTIRRHWPTANTDLALRTDIKPMVRSVCDLIARTTRIASEQHRLEFTVTAGHDSRMVLACARDLAADARFFTYSDKHEETRDVHIAHRLATVARLEHRFIPFVEAKEDERAAWLNRTGHAAAGGIMNIHPTLQQLDPSCALVTGMGGEIGRSFYYRRGDYAQMPITSDVLLTRIGRPPSARLLEAGAHWLQSIAHYDPFVKLDLLYIENRLGCWAAPQRFSNLTSKFEFTPFNYRPLINTLLQLPRYYRWRDRLPYDVTRFAWPELMRFPVNRYTDGWRGMKDSLVAIVRETAGPIRYRGGEL